MAGPAGLSRIVYAFSSYRVFARLRPTAMRCCLEYIMNHEEAHRHKNHYRTLGLSLAVSFVTMYAVMFLNVDRGEHIRLSLTRTYMTLLMVAPMAVTMLLLMWPMFQNKGRNFLILAGAIIVFATSLILLRTQSPIGDVQYMKAMIPHHSSAIMTSRHADLLDPETQKLARQIIESQEREIAQMNALIQRLEAKSH